MNLLQTSIGRRSCCLGLASVFTLGAVMWPAPNSAAQPAETPAYMAVSPAPNYDCIYARAESHQPLAQGEQLNLFDDDIAIDFATLTLPDTVLEDAYFRGTLSAALDNLESRIPSAHGSARDAGFAVLRGIKVQAAKAAAGDCLPPSSFADQYRFSKTGLSKSHVMQLISKTYHDAQHNRTKVRAKLRG